MNRPLKISFTLFSTVEITLRGITQHYKAGESHRDKACFTSKYTGKYLEGEYVDGSFDYDQVELIEVLPQPQ